MAAGDTGLRAAALRRVADAVADAYAAHDEVETVALGGSLASGAVDAGSDIDLYVYLSTELPMAARAEIAWAGASYAEVGNTYWEPGDEWKLAGSGIHVDVMFRETAWITGEMARVLERHEASVGYTTCLWHNVLTSVPLFDRDGWFAQLQQIARQPYPEPLRQAIVKKNHPILRETASSYRYQIAAAARRDDWVSLNHRVAALLASYFDILFAVNRRPNPGEKRLLRLAAVQCGQVPTAMADRVRSLIAAVPGDAEVVACVDALVDGLDALLRGEGMI
ncbi:MAG: DUF4037 domain-containing protein [Anaerolineae bacterium]|nr:DUF4037 domain-containing protein [Anaerolineae bacterium]